MMVGKSVLYTLVFANYIKYWKVQGRKGVKGPSEQILILVFIVFYVIACDLKISIYKLNYPFKKMCTH